MASDTKLYSLFFILLILLIATLYQNNRLEQKYNQLSRDYSNLNLQIEVLEKRIKEKEKIVFGDPKQLEDGLYVATAKISVGKNKKSKDLLYEIYHIKYGIAGHALNIGIAVSGFTKVPIIYMDYNSDGEVDLDIMYEFIDYIPMADLLKKAINVEQSQAAYNALIDQHQSAKYFPPEIINEKGGAIAKELIDFIESHYQALEDWILGNQDKLEEKPQSSPEVIAS